MDVRLLTSLVTKEQVFHTGDVFSCDDATAIRMIESGQAVPVRVGGLELAVSDGPRETAVSRVSRRRKRA